MSAVIGELRAELSASIATFKSDMGKAAESVKSIGGQMTRVGNDWRRIGLQMEAVGTSLTKTITLPLVGMGAAAFKAGADFEEAFAGVQKTVEGVVDDMGKLTPLGEDLRQGFRDLAKEIPVSVNELARLGEAAGALGIPTKDILQFTKVTAELGAVTKMTSDQAAESIAKIQNIYQSAGKDTDKFASTLVSLGISSAATEEDILDMARRIAGAGQVIGLTQGEVLAFATALSSVSIEAESGGTAISRTFVKLANAVNEGGEKLDLFAKVAHQSSAEFVRSFKDDAAGAITHFIEGLGGIISSGGNVFAVLDKLELGEVRVRDALLRSAGAGELLEVSLKQQAVAWAENTALTKAAEQRFTTFYGSITKLWNRIKDIGITLYDVFRPALIAGLDAIEAMLPIAVQLSHAFEALPKSLQVAVLGFAALAAAFGPLLYISGQLIFSASQVALAFGKKGFAARALISILTGSGGLVGGLKTTTVAMEGVGIASKALTLSLGGVIGILVGGALLVAMKQYTDLKAKMETPAKTGALEGLKDGFGNALVPITKVNEQLTDFTGQVPTIGPKITVSAKALESFGDKAKGSAAAIGDLGEELKDTSEKLSDFEKAVRGVVSKFTGEGLLSSAEEYAEALKRIGGASHLTVKEAGELEDAFQDVIDKFRLMGPAGAEIVKRFTALRDSIRPIPQYVRDFENSAKALSDELSTLGTIFYPSMVDVPLASQTAFSRLNMEVGKLIPQISSAIEGFAGMGIQGEKASDSLNLTTDSLRQFREEAANAVSVGAQIGKNLVSSLEQVPQILVRALTGGGGIKGAIESIGSSIGSGIGGAIGKALGGPLGESIGSAIGSLAGAAVSKLADALTKSAGEKVMKDVGARWGIAITEALGDSIAKTAKELFKGNQQIAEAFRIGDIIEAGGGLSSGNIKGLTDKLRDIFVFISNGSMTAAQGAKVLDDNFKQFADHFLANGPLISKELVEIIRLNDELGVKSKAIGEFVTGQILTNVVAGLKTFTDASRTASDQLSKNKDRSKELKDSLGEMQGKLVELNDELSKETDPKSQQRLQEELAKLTQEEAKLKDELNKTNESISKQQGLLDTISISSQGAASALAASITVAFGKLAEAGTPIFEIVEQLDPIVQELGKRFEDAGFTGGAAFEQLKATMALARDEIAGPALQSVNALGQVLAGLSNTGLLTQDMFSGLTDQISTTFGKLIAGGADSRTALGLMQKPIQTIIELQDKFGFQVDEATQAIIDQAKEQGIAGDKFKPVQEQMLEATNRIATAVELLAQAFGVTLPQNAASGASSVSGSLGTITNDTGTTKKSVDDLGNVFSIELPRKGETGALKIRGSMADIVKGTDGVRQAVDGLGTRFSVDLPGKAQYGARLVTSYFENVRINIPIDFDVNVPELPTGDPIPGFAFGSGGVRDFGSGTLAMLHGREAVVTEDQIGKAGDSGDKIITLAPVMNFYGTEPKDAQTVARETIKAIRLGLVPEFNGL